MAEKHYTNRLNFRTRVRVYMTYEKGTICSFLVKLEYTPGKFPASEWIEVARFDHNPNGEGGHNVIEEGLHVDLNRSNAEEYTYWFPENSSVPTKLSEIVIYCENLLANHYERFVELYAGEIRPEAFEPDSLLESREGFNSYDE